MKKKKFDMYDAWVERKSIEMIKTFGSAELAIKCIDEILDVLTKIDNRCWAWNQLKDHLNKYQ